MTDIEETNRLISAYVDGELDASSAARVETSVAGDAAALRLLAIHRGTSAHLRAAFPADLYVGEPLRPLTMAVRRRPRNVGFGWAVAASLLVGAVGFGAGTAWPDMLLSGQTRMLADVAEYHAVYSRETVHLVEVPASQLDQLKLWLGTRVNRPLVVPDFKEAGLNFVGGRMVVLGGAPAAELIYARKQGLPIALCIVPQKGTRGPIVVEQRDAMQIATWNDGSHAWFVVGEADPETIRKLAIAARNQV